MLQLQLLQFLQIGRTLFLVAKTCFFCRIGKARRRIGKEIQWRLHVQSASRHPLNMPVSRSGC
jgi:hypothetical protein